MYNYFPHPSNARTSSALVALRVEEGAAGYGVYWEVIELLRDAPSYLFSSNPKAVAFAINEGDVGLVGRVLRNYGLFEFTDDEKFFSEWLCSIMADYDERKNKAAEAGKRGAAKRWGEHKQSDSNPIATPSQNDSNPIAYNPMPYNSTLRESTTPSGEKVEEWRGALSIDTQKVGLDLVAALSEHQPEGHAPAYVAQECARWGVSEGAFNFIIEHTNNAEVTHPTYLQFCALVKRLTAEKWKPNHPSNFFLSKLFG